MLVPGVESFLPPAKAVFAANRRRVEHNYFGCRTVLRYKVGEENTVSLIGDPMQTPRRGETADAHASLLPCPDVQNNYEVLKSTSDVLQNYSRRRGQGRNVMFEYPPDDIEISILEGGHLFLRRGINGVVWYFDRDNTHLDNAERWHIARIVFRIKYGIDGIIGANEEEERHPARLAFRRVPIESLPPPPPPRSKFLAEMAERKRVRVLQIGTPLSLPHRRPIARNYPPSARMIHKDMTQWKRLRKRKELLMRQRKEL
jgi:hypothetical protein